MPDSETTPTHLKRFMFPRWANLLAPVSGLGVVGGLLYATTLFAFGASPKTMGVGYAPDQPVRYSHALHAGKLGLDCRYCHNTVERTPFASLPPTQTCMNCHTKIWNTSEFIKPIQDSWSTGKPIEWIKIHNLPNYVYFNHSAHVNHGVGCIECHGRIDRMDVVYQFAPLSMGWCLECHRAPESHLRPRDVRITDMDWKAPQGEEGVALGQKLRQEYQLRDTQYMTSCSTCHR